MAEEFPNDTLFSVIRAGLGLNHGEINKKIDYQELIVLGKRHSIMPIIRQGLLALGLTGDGYKQVDDLCLLDLYLFVNRNYAIESIYKCFEKNAIYYIPLIGSVLRNLYPDCWMRTSCDIDILVREKDLEKAVNVLELETELKFKERLFHDISLVSPNVHLELHFSIKEDMDSIDQLLSKAWDYVEYHKGEYLCNFTSEYLLFHVIAHMAYHFVHGGLGIRPYVDLWLLRHKTQYDEEIVRKMCDKCDILKFYEACCNLSEIWLEGKPHSQISKSLEKYCIEGGVFGSNNNLMLSKQRKKKGIRYLIGRLFISNNVLKEIYPKAKRHPILLPYYQIRRWPKALLSKKKSVIQEIKTVLNTPESEIEPLDQLMRSVGM